MRTRSFLAFALPFLFACGSSVAEAPSELTTSCQDLGAQAVDYLARCGGDPSSAAHRQAYVDACVGIVTAPGAQLTVTDVDACTAQLAGACDLVGPSCFGYGGNLLYPNHDRPGTRAPGESCFTDVQCDSGYCGADFGACGACQEPRKLGESCAGANDLCVDGGAWCLAGSCAYPGSKLGEDCTTYGGGDCQESLFCKPLEPNGLEGKCAPPGGPGAACGQGLLCAVGFFCDGAACAAQAAIGGACADDTGCVTGAFCHAGSCSAPLPDGAVCDASSGCLSGACRAGTCHTLHTGLVEGADCSVDYCRPDLTCTDTQVCARPNYLPAGAKCLGTSEPSLCAPGLYCDYACAGGDCGPSVCVALPKAGEHCSSIATCADDATCTNFSSTDLNQGLCVKLGGVGEACPCTEELACVAGACAAFGAAVCDAAR
jgi:hypothetical protein